MNQTNFDLLKSHIDQYTRKDGSVVQAHDDKRTAAAPQYHVAHNVQASGEGPIHEIKSKAGDVEKKLNMKPGSLSAEQGGHYSQSHQIKDASGKRHSIYSNGGEVRIRPVGHNDAAATEALKRHIDGQSEGGAGKPAALATHADALARSSKPGDLDHTDNQIAAGYMKTGDHKSLAGHLKNLDTAARDHILDHVHPDHREGLGFKQLNMERSKKQYAAKFSEKSNAK